METGPPALIEAFDGRLIPPASREHVVGEQGRLSPGLVFLLCGMFSNADLEERLADQLQDDSDVREASDRRTLGRRSG